MGTKAVGTKAVITKAVEVAYLRTNGSEGLCSTGASPPDSQPAHCSHVHLEVTLFGTGGPHMDMDMVIYSDIDLDDMGMCQPRGGGPQ